jgi:PTH2 family peptidyl-tRNA hydrolase
VCVPGARGLEHEQGEGALRGAATPRRARFTPPPFTHNAPPPCESPVIQIAAQAGHAFLGVYRVALRLPLPSEWVRAWLFRAQAKIALKVDSEAEMDAIITAARAAGLPTYTIEDAGRTEVEPGTRTVTAIGPAPKALLDAITGPKGSHACRLLA